MAEWYYTKGNNKYGPVSNSELKQLADSGKLVQTDLVWKEGASDWKPASIVRGLFPEDKQSPTPPLPTVRPFRRIESNQIIQNLFTRMRVRSGSIIRR